jgi:hypothetical protein
MNSESTHCCDSMTYHAEYICPDTDAIHDGDPLGCPDRLAVRWSDGSYGLLIHDGGSSRIDISFCPWCGRGLPSRDINER